MCGFVICKTFSVYTHSAMIGKVSYRCRAMGKIRHDFNASPVEVVVGIGFRPNVLSGPSLNSYRINSPPAIPRHISSPDRTTAHRRWTYNISLGHCWADTHTRSGRRWSAVRSAAVAAGRVIVHASNARTLPSHACLVDGSADGDGRMQRRNA